MYYSAIGTLAVLVLLIENQDLLFRHVKAFEQRSWQVYRRFLFAILIYYVTDILWGIIESHKLTTLLFIDTTVYFFAMASCIILWTLYVVTFLDDKTGFGRAIKIVGEIIATIITVLTTLNIFVPVTFVVKEGCVYEALPARYVMITIQISFLILISVYAFVTISKRKADRGQAQWKRYRTIALFGAIMAVFLFVQLIFPLLPAYSIALMLGTCLIRAHVIADEKEEFKNSFEEANKIAELKHTISSLLDNMPAMCFSKDAETGVYVSCNQGFLEYAHKKSQDEVIGLTDHQIFDKETADHFVEKDHITLEMDEPYVFMEDVPDAAGIPKRLQTTKLKYIDTYGRLCVLGMCQDITEMLRVQREYERVREAHRAFARINALAGDFLCVYTVIPETGFYREFSTAEKFKQLNMPSQGDHFREDFMAHCMKAVYEEDKERFLQMFTMENMSAEIKQTGIVSISFRMLLGEEPRHVQLKAAIIEEENGKRLIVGINDIESLVRHEEDFARRLSQAQRKANVDPLTGVKNKHAYLNMEDQLNTLIEEGQNATFAVTILDINDLKYINDNYGHQAGDQYIKDACKIICDIFRHSPVFRVGGDEFTVISVGEDFERIDELVELVNAHNKEAVDDGGIVIAVGMSKSSGDKNVAAVYDRADAAMYKDKSLLKAGRETR